MKIIYIDMQNIHKSTEEMGRLIDRELFFIYLKNKLEVQRIIMFIGYVQKYRRLYDKLTSIGYEIIFKNVLVRPDGSIKGDVDIDIAIHAMKHIHQNIITQAYLITGDADYNTLIDERVQLGLFAKLLVPNLDKTMYILRKSAGGKIQPLTDIKHLIQKKQKD